MRDELVNTLLLAAGVLAAVGSHSAVRPDHCARASRRRPAPTAAVRVPVQSGPVPALPTPRTAA